LLVVLQVCIDNLCSAAFRGRGAAAALSQLALIVAASTVLLTASTADR